MKIYNYSNEIIRNWQHRHPSLVNLTDIILSLISANNGTVLDVGCGTGRTSILLAKRGLKVDAIDIEPKIISIAKETTKEAGVNVSYSVVDFTKKSISLDKEYDLIVCSEVLEHVEDYKNIIENMHNFLKEDGTLIVTVPHDPRQYSILDVRGGHLRRYTISKLKEDLKKFRITDCFTFGFPFTRMLVGLRLFIIKILKKKPSPEKEWNNSTLSTFISFLLYKLTKFDNYFNFLNKGTNIICKAKKISNINNDCST